MDKDETGGTLDLVNLTSRKSFYVYVEEVRKGDKLLFGGYADHDYTIVDSDRPIPKYVENKINELMKEHRIDENNKINGDKK